MTIEVRRTSEDEYRTASGVVATALLFPPQDDESWARSQPSWDEMSSFTAWDGDTCVGHAGQFFVETTVPGGAQLTTGAVTRVGVLPTHRRRGVATGLMEALIAESAERGVTLMSLRASEAVIYQRFGFGLAGEFIEASIDAARARPVAGQAVGGHIRLLRPDEIIPTIREVYDRCVHRRVGIVTRPDSWWERYFRDAVTATKSSYVVVHVDGVGVVDGVAHYDVAWNEDGQPGGHGEIHDVFGIDDAVELALWGYLLDIDLVRTWKADERPVDDIVRAAISDRRAYSVKSVDDEQWLRLVDVETALAARTYNAATDGVVIGVTDPLVASNNGSWRVSATGAVATSEAADLAVDIATLSATYLGGVSWELLAAVGQVEVRTPGATCAADTLFASHLLPFCGSFF
jgi:predicted acetyltransferase